MNSKVNREDIIRMAQEAGFIVDEISQQHQPNCIQHTWYLIDEGLERFAKLVYEHAYASGCVRAEPVLEQNFCCRCGKRTKDIHTCTPP